MKEKDLMSFVSFEVQFRKVCAIYINVPWTDEILSKDRIRTFLKSTFYPDNFIVFNF